MSAEKVLRCDLETRSTVELRDHGVYVYAESEHTGIWCLAWAFDDGPVKQWLEGQPFPREVADHVAVGGIVAAWNVQFELALWNHVGVRRYGWPSLPISQARCEMAESYAMSLPGALDNAAAAVGMTEGKDPVAYRVMLQLSRPRRMDGDKPVWWDDESKLQQLYAYNKKDVEIERAISKKLRRLSPAERNVWLLDMAVNQRGVAIDRTLCHRAQRVVERATKRLDDQLRKITGNAVTAVSNVQQLKSWVNKQGVPVESVAKEAITDLLAEEYEQPSLFIPPAVREALEIRQEGGKTSTAKIQSFVNYLGKDGRARGLLQYHGAGTGRWAGRGPQVQNLPRPKLEQDEIEEAIDFIMAGQDEILEMLHGGVPGTVSDCIRGMIVAGPGKMMYSADFANIEGRVLAWWAGEQWKLRAFREYDAGTGPDLYKVAAGGIFGIPVPRVSKDQRQIGKVAELACFGPETLVLTEKSGYKAIVEVAADDRVWDGVEWVSHGGVICRGRREVIDLAGVAVTPEHLILTGPTWRPAQQLASNGSILSQALATGSANSPLSASTEPENPCTRPVSWCGVLAAPNPTRSPTAIFSLVDPRDVTGVPSKNLIGGAKTIGATLTSFLTTITADVCSTASRLVSTVATTRTMPAMPTTAGGACTSSRRGGLTAEPSWRTLSHWLAGMTQRWNLTAERSTKATNREIFGSSPARPIKETVARFRSCSGASLTLNRKSVVYDLTLCSARQRFTILTNAGPLIVHNCGYQGGVGAFVAMAKTYGMKIERYADIILKGADPAHVEQAEEMYAKQKRKGDRNVFVPAEVVKIAWRERHPLVVELWNQCEYAALEAVRHPGAIYKINGVRWRVNGSFLWCALPSGRLICYPYPRIADKETPWGAVKETVFYKGVDSRTRKWGDQHLYGGKSVENVVQAIARDVMAEAMVRVEGAGYEVVMTVHDEVVAEHQGGDVEQFKALMATLPGWARGLPVAVEGWAGRRYRK